LSMTISVSRNMKKPQTMAQVYTIVWALGKLF
jgi:hypothetical protein